jgi:hypothetical protein
VNNLEALTTANCAQIAQFLLRLLQQLQLHRAAQTNAHPANTNASPRFLDLSRYRQWSRGVRELSLVTAVPAQYYWTQPLFDFDLPPTLVTQHEARQLLDLLRRGGRLQTRAVQKLLRLSYRLLKNRQNTTRLHVGLGERLIVVGDIHGECLSSSIET